MSLEYPPTAIAAANTWIKDLQDTTTGYVGSTSNQPIAKYKTLIQGNTYGNGEYIAWTTDIYSNYTHGTTYHSNEWPASGAFDKSEGDGNTQLSSHTGRNYPNGSDQGAPGELGICLPDRIKLTSFSIKSRTNFAKQAPSKFKLSGRNNQGDSWTDITTETKTNWSGGDTATWNVTPTEYFSEYKFTWYRAQQNNNLIAIYTIKLYGVPFHHGDGISFKDFDTLPFTRGIEYTGSQGSGISLKHGTGIGLKDIMDIKNVTDTYEASLIGEPTMYNGKFYLGHSATYTHYFPTPFLNKPGVFFNMHYAGLGNNDNTHWPCQITEVTSTYFIITNPNSSGMDPIIHWMAVKQGTGTIYGLNFKCNIRVMNANWSSHQTMEYTGLGSTPVCLANLQTRNASGNKYSPNLGGNSSSTQVTYYIGINSQEKVYNAQTVSTGETIAMFALEKSDVSQKVYSWTAIGSNAGSTPGTSTNGEIIRNPICLGCSRNGGGNTLNHYIWKVTSQRTQWYIKEVPGRDGGHGGVEDAHVITMTGTTNETAKPLMHFCANYASEKQGIADDANMSIWRNISERAGKYAVGYGSGSHRPTLKNDANGKYVQFDKSNSEYFKLPCPINWNNFQESSVATGGVTAFAVAKFKNLGTDDWPRLFEFTNVTETAQTTYTLNSATYYKAIDEGTSGFGGTLYGNAQNKSGYVELTSAGNSQNGQIQWSNMNPGDRLYATFDSWTGGGNGADALWFYWGCSSRPTGEDFNSGGYSFAIDEYNSNQLQLEFNNTRLETKSVGNIDDSTWHSWIVEYKNNTITVTRDGTEQFSKVDSARTLSTLVGWGARTGGLNNRHLVRNMKVYVSANNGTGYIVDGGSSHSDNFLWARNGTGNQMRFQAMQPTVQYDTTNNPASSDWKVYGLKYENGRTDKSCKMSSDAVDYIPTETTQNTLDNRTTNRNLIGANKDLGAADIDLREIILWDVCLSNTQFSDINAHLCDKWGITNGNSIQENNWYLVFRQTYPYQWANNSPGLANFKLNVSDSSNDNYSIFHEIDNYRNSNNVYRFKYKDPGTGRYNDWRQTSHPYNSANTASGYEAVKLNQSTNQSFGGLNKSSTSSTILDGSPNAGNWWYAVGSVSFHGGSYPGLGYSHSVIELYAMKENIGTYTGTRTTAYSNLLAWYRCEESSGSTLTDSKGSYNMTLHNSSHYSRKTDSVDEGTRCIELSHSSNNKAFDSTSKSYGLAELTNLGSINPNCYTISTWVKFTNNSHHRTIWQFNRTGHYATFHRLSYICDGGGYWHFQTDYKETSSGTRWVDALSTTSGAVNYADGVWHNVVITKSGNTSSDVCKFYADGSLVTSFTLTNSGGKSWGFDSLTFGSGWHYNKWNWWSKAMKTDDYRIYNAALSADQVSELFEMGGTV